MRSPVCERIQRVSETYDVADPHTRPEGLAAALQAAQSGEPIVLPTDTVYGIGVDAFSATGVTVLLAAKGRSRAMPPPVLIARHAVMDALAADIPDAARRLAETFWPGGMTLILQAQPSLAWDLGQTRGTVALRMPADEVALELLGTVGPMAVSSANRTGQPAATTAAAAQEMLADSVSVYLDAGERASTAPSTIIDCTVEPPRIVREGSVPLHELQAAAPEVQPMQPEQSPPEADGSEAQA